MRWRRGWAVSWLVVAAASGPAAAHAQTPGDAARADALFAVARRLRDAKMYSDACPTFAEVERIAPAVGVMLHLADCYEHVGQPASALAEFRKAEALAQELNDRRVDVARARAAALDLKLKQAIPSAKSNADAVAALLTAEPATDSSALVAVASPVPSPPVAVPAVAVAPPVPSSPVAVPVAVTPVPSPNLETSPSSATLRSATRAWVELGLLGAGVLGVGAGAALLAIKDQALSNGSDASTAGAASAFAFAAGGAAIVSSVVLYLTAPGDTSDALVLSPAPLVGGAGALLRGSF